MFFILLILISSIFSLAYTQVIYGEKMIMEKMIEESVRSNFNVYCINSKWFIVDWSMGEVLILSDNARLRRKFGDVYGIKGSGRWENGIIIGYRDTARNPHVVLYDITKDSLADITDQIPVGRTFTNIREVILPTSGNWAATLINSSEGYLYYNSNSFKKVATFQWVRGTVFLFSDTILIGFGASTDDYGNYVIVGGYYIMGQDPRYGLKFFFEEIIPDHMVISGDITNNRILIPGNGDIYIFDIPSFNLISKQKLLNGNFMGADITMLNENFGYIAFSSFNSTKIYKFVYSSDMIVLIDSLIVDGGLVKFMKFDGSIYSVIFQNPYDYGFSRLIIYKIKNKATSVGPKNKEIPSNFKIYQNYPNPFNPTTTISYDLPERVKVKLSIYNLLGQEVATLIEGEQEPGRYDVKFDASGLPSGVYFYRLEAGNFIEQKKMILIK
jgi:hypothetical protein